MVCVMYSRPGPSVFYIHMCMPLLLVSQSTRVSIASAKKGNINMIRMMTTDDEELEKIIYE